MRRKSDAFARRFFQLEAIGPSRIQTALQLFLIVEELDHPDRDSNEQQDEKAGDQIDARPVLFFFCFRHLFVRPAFSVAVRTQIGCGRLFGSKKARILGQRLLGLRDLPFMPKVTIG